MTAPTLDNFIAFMSNFGVFVFANATALIAFWENYRARLNQYVGSGMFMLALWGGLSAILKIKDTFDIEVSPWLEISTISYFVAIVLFIFFLSEFDARRFRYLRLFYVLWVGAIVVFTIMGSLWTIETLDTGYQIEMNPLGRFMSATLALVSIGFIYLLLTKHKAMRGAAISTSLPLLVGGLSVILNLRTGPQFINHVAAIVGIMLTARYIVREPQFNPLAQLYRDLATKNADLEEASRLKSEFLANMSHELRTPLNSIIGYTELVTMGTYGNLTDHQLDRLEKVTRNGKKLLELINNVLDLSKLDAGRMDIQPVAVSPANLIGEVLKTLEPLVTEKALAVVRHDHDLPTLYVDEVRTRQILLNVLANIFAFSDPTSTITISGYLDANRNQVVLTIGSIGIRSKDAFNLAQVLNKNGANAASAGLGLTISQRLAELHGGNIWFGTEPGRGSTFYISLPALSDIKHISHLIPPPAIANDTRRPLILVIDDDIETIEVIQDYLHPEGYRVYGALSGREGLLRAHELQPQIITLDVVMPVMDGWAVLETLKANSRLQAIPVVIISITEQHILSQQLGAAATLTKPVTKRMLLHTFRTLERKQEPAR